MTLDRVGSVFALVTLAATIIGWSAMFTVDPTQQVLVVRLGQPMQAITEPGLNFKAPFIDSVIPIDKRVLDLEVPAQEVIASDQKRLVVSSFARYRVLDPLKFYQTVGSISEANARLSVLLISALRRVLGEASFIQVLRDERAQLMTSMRDQLNREAGALGISIVDVRVRSVILPEQNSQAIYHRMQTERQREAAEIRAQGSQRSQEIRAKADRDVTILIAEATSKSEKLRGVGDAERNRIFADAFGKDLDFSAFYRSMQAYETAFQHDNTLMLLRTDSEFLRYFVDPSGKKLPTESKQ
jgi:modulator of FtsH protease HflC